VLPPRITTLRRGGVSNSLKLIRAPQPEALDNAALPSHNKIRPGALEVPAAARQAHEVVLMVDVSDLPRGRVARRSPRLVEQVLALPRRSSPAA
jgi:hypothetical protein